MEYSQIVLAIISALSGGALATYLTFKLGSRKQEESEFSTLVSQYKELTESYKLEVVELRKEVQQIRIDLNFKENEVIQLRNQLMIFESSHVDVPVPIWLKDTEGKMLFLNDEYEKAVLNPSNKTRADYLGKKDIEVWGQEVGSKFYNNDKEVMRKKHSVQFIEQWEGDNGVVYEGRVIKYPRFLNRTVIGIGGIIIESTIHKKQDKL